MTFIACAAACALAENHSNPTLALIVDRFVVLLFACVWIRLLHLMIGRMLQQQAAETTDAELQEALARRHRSPSPSTTSSSIKDEYGHGAGCVYFFSEPRSSTHYLERHGERGWNVVGGTRWLMDDGDGERWGGRLQGHAGVPVRPSATPVLRGPASRDRRPNNTRVVGNKWVSSLQASIGPCPM
ncbi:hypothetical protein U9M48_002383 [Paspalum notatum var. saurae]|uniref:Uncharacterized protein n=1 Tax=Paspalum notatum var. saurae TaxID=547442 RepID=A0AAQ3PJQ5_PASNO